MQKDEDKLVSALKILARLLSKYQLWHKASFVEELIELRDVGSPELYAKINSIEMWGGMGSMWDLGKFRAEPPDITEQEANDDDVRLRRAMILLVDQMEQEGLLSESVQERAHWIADVFRTWNEKGL